MGKRKTPEQLADEERRYALAHSATTLEDFALLAGDENQAIRAAAAHNRGASAEALALFVDDRLWGARIEIALHPNATTPLLLQLLEPVPRKRGVVHNAAKDRLIAEGMLFDEEGLPVIDQG